MCSYLSLLKKTDLFFLKFWPEGAPSPAVWDELVASTPAADESPLVLFVTLLIPFEFYIYSGPGAWTLNTYSYSRKPEQPTATYINITTTARRPVAVKLPARAKFSDVPA